MKRLLTITAIALSSAMFISTANADQVDANNPNVTNERVDADGDRDIQSRFDECKQLQASIPTDATQQQIDAFTAERVAPYKKVRQVAFVDEIPKSASGKILRRVLVAQDRA